MVLEAVKSKIKELADLMSDKNLLPGLQMAAFSLHAHMASPWCVCEAMSSSSYKATNPIMRIPPS